MGAILLLQRVLSAIILVPIVLVATYQGNMWLFALTTCAALIAGYEYFHMLRQGGYRSVTIPGLIAILLIMLDTQWPEIKLGEGGITLFCLIALAIQISQGNRPGSLADWAVSVTGAVYIGWSAHHFITLRALDNGLWWVLLVFAITWSCDSAAYFVGRAWGKHPFFAKISPHKTTEGALAGLIAGPIVALIAGLLTPLPWPHATILGLIGAIGCITGDLAESVVKRQLHVKDTSNLIPGHGGMLDRIDSLLYNIVLVYYYLYWILGIR